MNPDQQKLETITLAAEMLKAMAHPMQINIVSFLEWNQKMTVTEIYERLGIEQAVTSHHLGILKSKRCSDIRARGEKYLLLFETLWTQRYS